MIPFYVKVTII